MVVKLQRKNCPSFCNPCHFCHYFNSTGNPKCQHPDVGNVDCVVEDVVYVKVDLKSQNK